VLAETHYPGWELAVSTNGGPAAPHPILRTNGCMRGVMLPAGRHELTFRYRPASFWRGVAIGSCTWVLLLAIGLRAFIRRWRRRGR
jgi:hypothetical protein